MAGVPNICAIWTRTPNGPTAQTLTDAICDTVLGSKFKVPENVNSIAFPYGCVWRYAEDVDNAGGGGTATAEATELLNDTIPPPLPLPDRFNQKFR